MSGAYVLMLEAEAHLRGMIRYTGQQRSDQQVRVYIGRLERGIARLAARQGAYRDMSDLYPKLLMAHCEHHDAFALPREGAPALIVAILHEWVDLMTRLAERLKK